MQNRNDLIYIPEEGLPILIPKAHRYATAILNAETTYVKLPPTSGLEFTLYHQDLSQMNKKNYPKLNNWMSNIYSAANYPGRVYGGVLALVTRHSNEIQHGQVISTAGDLVKPDNSHIQLLQDSLSREAISRANIMLLQ